MISRKTIALSVAALVVSASAAMAATTHHHRHDTSARRAETAAEARASYAAVPDARYQAGIHYYGANDNGSVWSFYPGYVPTARN